MLWELNTVNLRIACPSGLNARGALPTQGIRSCSSMPLRVLNVGEATPLPQNGKVSSRQISVFRNSCVNAGCVLLQRHPLRFRLKKEAN